MTYKEALTRDMTWVGKQKGVVILGQGVATGDRMYHTLDGIPKRKCREMPVAENLIMGVALGMSITGHRPVVVFQRMDFMLIAADQIINHLALIPQMSCYQYQLPVIIRACIGSRDPKFEVGPQHNHDFRHVFKRYMATVDYRPGIYKDIYTSESPILVVEERDKYGDTV